MAFNPKYPLTITLRLSEQSKARAIAHHRHTTIGRLLSQVASDWITKQEAPQPQIGDDATPRLTP